MKKANEKKLYILLGVLVLLFGFMSYFSLTSISQLRGNARVVNYTGIVRGATQRLIKKELQGYADDALLTRLDGIVEELIIGEGPNQLIVLKDKDFLSYMHQVQGKWDELKTEISYVREGNDKSHLFDLSEDYFVLVDKTVSAAEIFSEKQVDRSITWLMVINGIFLLLLLFGGVGIAKSASLKRRAEALGKIAYLDPLTQMPNRASCEQEIDRYNNASVPNQKLSVFMFDMNNLKRVNDLLGHQGGDRIIADFARIIKTEGASYGFVGRYGGDEFVAIFPNGSEAQVQEYLTRINEKTISYNLLHVTEVEKISFAVGYVIEDSGEMKVEEMIDEADRKMYIRKREMKENKEA